MKQTRYKAFKLLALVAALAFVLASCSNGTDGANPQAHDSMVRINLALASGELSTSSLSPQGAPYDPVDGAAGVEVVEVVVTDTDSAVVTFSFDNGTYTADAGGNRNFISLTDDAVVTVLLPQGGNSYTFTSSGYDHADGSTEATSTRIAHAVQTQDVAINDIVRIHLESVIGAAQLDTRFPTVYATPGELLDLMLEVTANDRPDLRVPLGDFDVQYTVTSSNASIDSESNRGVRILVDDHCVDGGPVSVSATVTGLVEDNGVIVTDSVSADLDINCPPFNPAGVVVDFEPPVISDFSYDETTGQVTLAATDNHGIAKVEIWDGIDVIASTEGANPEVSYANGQFSATLAPDLAGIVAIVTDHSGNEASSSESANRMFVYVDSGSTNGDGSADNPFATLNEAYDFVAPGGTIFVLEGSYSPTSTDANPASPFAIRKPGVSLIGPWHGDSNKGDVPATINSTLRIEAENVTVSGLNFAVTGRAITFVTGQWTNTMISDNRFDLDTSADRALVSYNNTTGHFYRNEIMGPDGSPGVIIDGTSVFRVEDNFFWDSSLSFTNDITGHGLAIDNWMYGDSFIEFGVNAKPDVRDNRFERTPEIFGEHIGGMRGYQPVTLAVEQLINDYCADNAAPGLSLHRLANPPANTVVTWKITEFDTDPAWTVVSSCD